MADSSPSSPDASRDDGWSWSAVDSLGAGIAERLEELRFRLVEGEVEEAIVSVKEALRGVVFPKLVSSERERKRLRLCEDCS